MKLYKHTNGTCNASGPAIRALREKAGISQEQLAAKLQLAGLNLNQKAVSRIETGDRVVPDFELNYFATVLGVPVCTLLEYKKECALAHSRAEARLLQQPSTFAPSAHPCGALFCFIGRNFL